MWCDCWWWSNLATFITVGLFKTPGVHNMVDSWWKPCWISVVTLSRRRGRASQSALQALILLIVQKSGKPVDMANLILFTGFYTSQVVSRISSINNMNQTVCLEVQAGWWVKLLPLMPHEMLANLRMMGETVLKWCRIGMPCLLEKVNVQCHLSLLQGKELKIA